MEPGRPLRRLVAKQGKDAGESGEVGSSGGGGKAAVQEFRMIYPLLSTYFHRRVRRDRQQKFLPKGLLL